eukprot:TRINITY_DN4634_c0_g1_i1.p1 TRINITY_DN4634_c0_g1~~TRINITY_DN4634_c0_g1_i1.p1  ORF type:complete len:425 (-),score=65.00 TRINITY_DN4634_c0_g1_i1:58-1332(-)
MDECGSQPSQPSLRAPSARSLVGLRSGSVEKLHSIAPWLAEYDVNNPCYESLREFFFQCVKLIYQPHYVNNFREEEHEHLFHSDMANLLVQCGVNDFGLFDLLQPEPRKVKKVIHALTRFSELHLEVTQRCSTIQTTIAKAQEERVAATKETHFLEAEKADFERRKADQQMAVLELQNKLEELTRKLNELQAQDSQVKLDKAAVTKRINTLQEESTALALEQKTLGQEVQTLAASVVSSPDRIFGEYNAARGRVDSARERLAQLETRIANAQALFDAVTKAGSNLQLSTVMGQQSLETRERRRTLKTELRHVQLEEKTLRTQAAAVSDQLQRLRAQLLETNHDIATKAEAVGSAVNGDATLVSKEEQELLKRDAEQGVNVRMQLLKQMQTEHTKEMEVLVHKFHEVEEQVVQYCERALAELDAL